MSVRYNWLSHNFGLESFNYVVFTERLANYLGEKPLIYLQDYYNKTFSTKANEINNYFFSNNIKFISKNENESKYSKKLNEFKPNHKIKESSGACSLAMNLTNFNSSYNCTFPVIGSDPFKNIKDYELNVSLSWYYSSNEKAVSNAFSNVMEDIENDVHYVIYDNKSEWMIIQECFIYHLVKQEPPIYICLENLISEIQFEEIIKNELDPSIYIQSVFNCYLSHNKKTANLDFIKTKPSKLNKINIINAMYNNWFLFKNETSKINFLKYANPKISNSEANFVISFFNSKVYNAPDIKNLIETIVESPKRSNLFTHQIDKKELLEIKEMCKNLKMKKYFSLNHYCISANLQSWVIEKHVCVALYGKYHIDYSHFIDKVLFASTEGIEYFTHKLEKAINFYENP